MGLIREGAVARGVASAAAVVVAVAACGESVTGPGGRPDPITELPRGLSASERAVIGAGNRFAVDLLRQVHGTLPDSTVFLSPLSASMALGMTMNGAAGATRPKCTRCWASETSRPTPSTRRTGT